jgi:hypothetical protein
LARGSVATVDRPGAGASTGPAAVKAKPRSADKSRDIPARVTSPAQPSKQATVATTADRPGMAQSLDLASLEQRLRDSQAIGVFTKLSLKNQVDDLLAQFRAYHRKESKTSLTELRQRYNLLLLKVLSLLQDSDPPLAAAISSSREAIWSILTDPEKFAKI